MESSAGKDFREDEGYLVGKPIVIKPDGPNDPYRIILDYNPKCVLCGALHRIHSCPLPCDPRYRKEVRDNKLDCLFMPAAKLTQEYHEAPGEDVA